MRLYESLLNEMYDEEKKANPKSSDLTKIKYILIQPKIYYDLMEENAEETKKGNRPFLEYNQGQEIFIAKFFGVPMILDIKPDKWTIVI